MMSPDIAGCQKGNRIRNAPRAKPISEELDRIDLWYEIAIADFQPCEIPRGREPALDERPAKRVLRLLETNCQKRRIAVDHKWLESFLRT